MPEIIEVLKRHDIAGYIMLHESGYSEFLLHISPRWSVLRFKGQTVRFRRDYGGDRTLQQAHLKATLTMLAHFRRGCERDGAIISAIIEQLRHLQIVEGEGTLTPASPESGVVH